MRIVSLVPSVTETLLAWGITPIAVTRFCEQPTLPSVGGTKDPDVAAIVDLAPDLVVVNDEENRREDADALVAAGLGLHVVHLASVADVAPAMNELARRVDVDEPQFDVPPARPSRLRAFVPIWRRPWMTMGGDCYGSSLLAHVGVANVFGGTFFGDGVGDRYPEITLDDVQARSPDVVLAPTEPYPFAERHRSELESVAPVTFVDGQDLFWWGARTPAAITRLQAVVDGLT